MNKENNTPPKPSFGARLGNALVSFLRALVRLLLILVLAGVIWAGLYYGIPSLYRSYIQPVQQNATDLEELQAVYQQDKDLFDERLEGLQSRLEDLEIQNDNLKLTLDSLQTQLTVLENDLADQATTLEKVGQLESSIDQNQETIESLGAALDEVSLSVEASAEEIEALSGEPGVEEETLTLLRQELALLKVMDLLGRARLSLLQGNLGLAQQDVRTALRLVSDLRAQVQAGRVEPLSEIIMRLELVEANLPAAPDLAYDDLEAAWGLLLRSLSVEPSEPTEPLSGALAPPTFTPTPTLEETEGNSTQGPTQTPTPTPAAENTP